MSSSPNNKSDRHPKIFLVLAGVMVAIAVLAYVFEEELFDMFYQEYTFLLILTGAVMGALFFLYAYRIPKIGLPLLGRSIELEEKTPPTKSVGVEYGNIAPSATDHKRAMTRHKSARRMRKQTARVTREMNNEKNNENGND